MAYPETFAAYYNARVRAMKSTLFAPSRLGDLLERGGLEELIEVLLNSPYEHEMAEALATHKGADAVEDAVSRSLVTSLRKLLRLADESFKRPAALFLLRWDLAAVKSLLRVRHLELTAEEGASALCPGPTLTVPLLRNLAGRESMPDVVAGLVAWNPELCACLPPELPAYRRIHSVAVFEEALDRRYFVETVEALRTPGQHAEVAAEDAWLLGRALAMEIDRVNLRVLFAALSSRAPGEATMARVMPQGTFPLRILRRMAYSGSVAETMEMLGRTPYRSLVEGLYPFMQTGRFSSLERFIDLAHITELRRMARRYIFSIAVLIDYAWQKSNEVTNLRLIARGHARHVPRARVREGLLYVQ